MRLNEGKIGMQESASIAAVAITACSVFLLDSEKAYSRMLEGYNRIAELKPTETSTISDQIKALAGKCYEALDDDLNVRAVWAMGELVEGTNKL